MSTIADAGDCFACASKLCRFAQTDALHARRRMFELNRGDQVETCRGGCVKLWTIISGTAAISSNLRDGRRQISGIEYAGSTICGPMAHEDSPIWIEALEPTRICEVDLSDRMGALQKDPEFMQVLFGLIHKRLEATTRHLTTLGRLDSTERVMLFLAETAEATPGHGPVTLPMNREEIADYLGLNAETVSRIFSKLRKSGLFKFLSPTEFVVVNREAVARRLPVSIARRPAATLPRSAAGTSPEPVGCPVPHHTETAS